VASTALKHCLVKPEEEEEEEEDVLTANEPPYVSLL